MLVLHWSNIGIGWHMGDGWDGLGQPRVAGPLCEVSYVGIALVQYWHRLAYGWHFYGCMTLAQGQGQ